MLKKILIATPCSGGMATTGYLMSVIKVMREAAQHGYEIDLLTNTDSLITRARNNVVAQFLGGDWQYLFFIDSDIAFEPSQFFRVVDFNQPVVTGGYPLKTYFPPINPNQNTGQDLLLSLLRYAVSFSEERVQTNNEGFTVVPEATTGFMCIQRELIETMTVSYPELKYDSDQIGLGAVDNDHHYLFFDTMVDGTRYLSEDYAFCRRVRALGVDIWLDMFSQLTHIGPHEFKGSIMDTIRLN